LAYQLDFDQTAEFLQGLLEFRDASIHMHGDHVNVLAGAMAARLDSSAEELVHMEFACKFPSQKDQLQFNHVCQLGFAVKALDFIGSINRSLGAQLIHRITRQQSNIGTRIY